MESTPRMYILEIALVTVWEMALGATLGSGVTMSKLLQQFQQEFLAPGTQVATVGINYNEQTRKIFMREKQQEVGMVILGLRMTEK